MALEGLDLEGRHPVGEPPGTFQALGEQRGQQEVEVDPQELGREAELSREGALEDGAVEGGVEDHQRTAADEGEQAGERIAGRGLELGVVGVPRVQQAAVDGDGADGEQAVALEVEAGGLGVEHDVARLEMRLFVPGFGERLPGLERTLGFGAQRRLVAAGDLEAGEPAHS